MPFPPRGFGPNPPPPDSGFELPERPDWFSMPGDVPGSGGLGPHRSGEGNPVDAWVARRNADEFNTYNTTQRQNRKDVKLGNRLADIISPYVAENSFGNASILGRALMTNEYTFDPNTGMIVLPENRSSQLGLDSHRPNVTRAAEQRARLGPMPDSVKKLLVDLQKVVLPKGDIKRQRKALKRYAKS